MRGEIHGERGRSGNRGGRTDTSPDPGTRVSGVVGGGGNRCEEGPLKGNRVFLKIVQRLKRLRNASLKNREKQDGKKGDWELLEEHDSSISNEYYGKDGDKTLRA